jgi:class 3 adenylate cyclase
MRELHFILLADVCRSTYLYDRIGDAAASRLMMQALDAAADATRANDGEVIDVRGDEILSTFKTAESALRAATDIHARVAVDAAMREHHIAFRIGINAGEIIITDIDIYGDAVNIAARVAKSAKARQTVLSDAVLLATPGLLQNHIRPLGKVTIRGKTGLQHLHELLSPVEQTEITEVVAQQIREKRSFLLRIWYNNRETRLTPLVERILLGRGTECDLLINHSTISREHAEIRYRNGRFVLVDFSTNGSQVSGDGGLKRAHRRSVDLLGSGSIQLGNTVNIQQHAIHYAVDDAKLKRN